mmetsp:Transcript_31340/g.91780  ORF Transcript_31340/g.91780 Transcript_31340/m.91780 type:complete len:210 (-) Transcript_31340:1543-2172(-)
MPDPRPGPPPGDPPPSRRRWCIPRPSRPFGTPCRPPSGSRTAPPRTWCPRTSSTGPEGRWTAFIWSEGTMPSGSAGGRVCPRRNTGWIGRGATSVRRRRQWCQGSAAWEEEVGITEPRPRLSLRVWPPPRPCWMRPVEGRGGRRPVLLSVPVLVLVGQTSRPRPRWPVSVVDHPCLCWVPSHPFCCPDRPWSDMGPSVLPSEFPPRGCR